MNNTNQSTPKRYQLLKECASYMSIIPSGTIFEKCGGSYVNLKTRYIFDCSVVENNPDWFQEIKEEPPTNNNSSLEDIYKGALDEAYNLGIKHSIETVSEYFSLTRRRIDLLIQKLNNLKKKP